VQSAELMSACGYEAPTAFLTPAAYQYFLPAFLLMYIEDTQSLDELVAEIERMVCPHEGWRRNFDVEGLSLIQQQAVLSFLLYVQRHFSEPILTKREKEIEGGINFWRARIETQVGELPE
jgi:hypothetical protein